MSEQAKIPADIEAVVIGAGHAGIESAWALGRLGHRVAMVTFDLGGVGRMSCNPSIGGIAKGQLVREIDALGGLMGRLIDRTGIHFRMLNRRKGPAVRAPRAQADKPAYMRAAFTSLAEIESIHFIEGEVVELVAEPDGSVPAGARVVGVRVAPAARTRSSGRDACDAAQAHGDERDGSASVARVTKVTHPIEVACRAVVLTSGTFLGGKVFMGREARSGGRRGEPSAESLAGTLRALGLQMGRLKTGTPPRLRADSIDRRALEVQAGDEPPPRFSFYEATPVRNQIVCHITHTNARTHAAIRAALDQSPLYSGMIRGIGPRYCPSIEDKVVRFPERASHHVFLEPEGLSSNEVYPNGISTSLPAAVQETFVRTIPGLECARIEHPGYAIEYDFLLTSQIDAALAVPSVRGLFAAGQVNGTSGYDEAAAQGLLAGVNARAYLEERPPVVVRRDQAYIGVLIDDLVTKIPSEPYRMFTSQAEYRLLLRQDNADLRLSSLGHELGLLSKEELARAAERGRRIAECRAALRSRRIRLDDLPSDAGRAAGLLSADVGRTLEEVLKRPQVDSARIAPWVHDQCLAAADLTTLEAETKYEGYIERQLREIEWTRKFENTRLPREFLDCPPRELSTEARETLMKRRPVTLGQAARMPGITPCDISLICIQMRTRSTGGRL